MTMNKNDISNVTIHVSCAPPCTGSVVSTDTDDWKLRIPKQRHSLLSALKYWMTGPWHPCARTSRTHTTGEPGANWGCRAYSLCDLATAASPMKTVWFFNRVNQQCWANSGLQRQVQWKLSDSSTESACPMKTVWFFNRVHQQCWADSWLQQQVQWKLFDSSTEYINSAGQIRGYSSKSNENCLILQQSTSTVLGRFMATAASPMKTVWFFNRVYQKCWADSWLQQQVQWKLFDSSTEYINSAGQIHVTQITRDTAKETSNTYGNSHLACE